MIEEIFQKRHRKKVQDLNIVPILDMLVTVIFFLLLSTSFLEYVKLTVPPAAIDSVATALHPPLAPKMLLVKGAQEGKQKLVLTWAGEKPGEAAETISSADIEAHRTELRDKAGKLAQKFAKDYPREKTLQLGLGGVVPFQDLISAMDGVREAMPDIVLISYAEAEVRANGSAP